MNVETELARLARRVRQLERKPATLATLVALAPGVRRFAQSIGPLSAGSVDVVVTWPLPFGGEDYIVLPELLTGTAALGAVHATLKAGTRTPLGCEVTVSSTTVVLVVVLDVIGIRP